MPGVVIRQGWAPGCREVCDLSERGGGKMQGRMGRKGRRGCLLVLAAAILAISAQPVQAQTAPPNPTREAPGTAPMPADPRAQIAPEEKLVDGPVKKVDAASKTVEVGWFMGLFGTKMAVTEETRIAVNGAKGSLSDVREGERVKASYEVRDGRNVATSIEVVSEESE
jgi:hypothetical protein